MMALACGKDPAGVTPPPPPPPIVKLIMAPDTGFWRGGAIRLSSLVRGAVTSHGDTVAAPAVTWVLPAGFTRSGDSLLATREARGTLFASFGSAVSDSTSTATMDDLSARGTWESEQRCYNSPNGHRGVEDPPIGVDSAIVTQSNGVLTYSDAHWGKGNFKAVITVDARQIRFWKDGVIDTVLGQTAIVATQDTLVIALGSSIGPAAAWMKRVADAPLAYRLDAPGTCSSDWLGGGSAFILRASQ
jgi:hypothetical protein